MSLSNLGTFFFEICVVITNARKFGGPIASAHFVGIANIKFQKEKSSRFKSNNIYDLCVHLVTTYYVFYISNLGIDLNVS